MSEQFTEYRTHSLTHPIKGVGMLHGFAAMSKRKHFSRQELEAHAVEIYEDDFLVKSRGESRHQEKFVLQGLCNGEWLTIKEVLLLPGEGPEPDYGNCQDCGDELQESDFAVGVICNHCLEEVYDEREAATW